MCVMAIFEQRPPSSNMWATCAWPITGLLCLVVLRVQGCIDDFDPVPYWCAPGPVEVGLAANVGGDEDRRHAAFQGVEAVVAQLP
ncbi:hypothetical protein D3C80_1591430 [compost metagenome]